MKPFPARRFSIVFVFLLGAMLVAKMPGGGSAKAPTNRGGAVATSPEIEPSVGGAFENLAPKSTLDVVKGLKTTAPIVPAPVTRTESKIVEYDLTVREASAKITPNLTYLSLWT